MKQNSLSRLTSTMAVRLACSGELVASAETTGNQLMLSLLRVNKTSVALERQIVLDKLLGGADHSIITMGEAIHVASASVQFVALVQSKDIVSCLFANEDLAFFEKGSQIQTQTVGQWRVLDGPFVVGCCHRKILHVISVSDPTLHVKEPLGCASTPTLLWAGWLHERQHIILLADGHLCCFQLDSGDESSHHLSMTKVTWPLALPLDLIGLLSCIEITEDIDSGLPSCWLGTSTGMVYELLEGRVVGLHVLGDEPATMQSTAYRTEVGSSDCAVAVVGRSGASWIITRNQKHERDSTWKPLVRTHPPHQLFLNRQQGKEFLMSTPAASPSSTSSAADQSAMNNNNEAQTAFVDALESRWLSLEASIAAQKSELEGKSSRLDAAWRLLLTMDTQQDGNNHYEKEKSPWCNNMLRTYATQRSEPQSNHHGDDARDAVLPMETDLSKSSDLEILAVTCGCHVAGQVWLRASLLNRTNVTCANLTLSVTRAFRDGEDDPSSVLMSAGVRAPTVEPGELRHVLFHWHTDGPFPGGCENADMSTFDISVSWESHGRTHALTYGPLNLSLSLTASAQHIPTSTQPTTSQSSNDSDHTSVSSSANAADMRLQDLSPVSCHLRVADPDHSRVRQSLANLFYTPTTSTAPQNVMTLFMPKPHVTALAGSCVLLAMDGTVQVHTTSFAQLVVLLDMMSSWNGQTMTSPHAVSSASDPCYARPLLEVDISFLALSHTIDRAISNLKQELKALQQTADPSRHRQCLTDLRHAMDHTDVHMAPLIYLSALCSPSATS